MSKLKIASFLLGITMLVIIIFIQVLNPLSTIDGWEHVNMEMTNTLQQQSKSSDAEVPEQQSNQPTLIQKSLSEPENKTEIETNNQEIIKTDTTKTDTTSLVQQPPLNSIININAASLEQLDVLPGIGPSKAKAIIDYRMKFGDFRSLEQIMEVKGIGSKLFEKMKDKIAITTAP